MGVKATPLGRSARAQTRPRPVHVLTQSLFLAPIGGIEVCTYQDALALVERGHKVDLVFGHEGPMRAEYEEAGVGLSGPHPFHFTPRHVFKALGGFVPAARWARKLKPDVLWLNRPEHIFWAQAISRWSRVPIVCHLHHLPNFRRMRLLSPGVVQFVAVSEFMKRKWVEGGIQSDRIMVIHNAISATDYPYGGLDEQVLARQILGLPPGIPIVLYYGRMDPDKGLLTLLEAWHQLGVTPDEALLVLVGPPEPQQVERLAPALARLPEGAYRWFDQTADVVSFLHAADLVAFPSWLEEAFGRVVIETMSTGRPVIASRVGAVPEILTGDMARFLVEPRDASALAEKIRFFLHWRDDEPELGADCKAFVESRFPYDAHIDALEEVLSEHGRHRTH